MRVLAASTGQPLECQLLPVPLEGNPIKYEAVSYVWGELKQTHNVICEGRRIPITKTLYTLLLHLRRADITRDIWVDQLSINQQDVTERSMQVLRMANIYQNAKQVIIWLGDDPRYVDVAFKTAARIGPVIAGLGTDHGISDDQLRNRGLPAHRSKEFEALGVVMQLPWFSRAWVVQEVCMANSATISCAPFSMPWSEFALVVSRLQSSGSPRMGGLYIYNGSPAERIGQIFSWQQWRTQHNTKADLSKYSAVSRIAKPQTHETSSSPSPT